MAYRYNATGNLISMTDWLSTTTFEVDLLHLLKSTTDHKGNTVTYAYDANKNLLHEYIRGNGTGQAKTDTGYSMDVLKVNPINQFGNPMYIVNRIFKGKRDFEQALQELEKELYAA